MSHQIAMTLSAMLFLFGAIFWFISGWSAGYDGWAGGFVFMVPWIASLFFPASSR